MLEETSRQAGDTAFGLDNRDALLRNVIENAEIPTFITTADGVVVYANRAFHNLLGYGANECIGLATASIVHPDDIADVRQRNLSLIRGEGERYQTELRYIRKNGTATWVLALPSLLVVGGRRIV